MTDRACISSALFCRITAEDGETNRITVSQTCALTSFDWERYPIGGAVVLMTREAYDRLIKVARGREGEQHVGNPYGLRCEKIPHTAGIAYMHDADDDSEYDVDGCMYCGRCHRAMPCRDREGKG